MQKQLVLQRMENQIPDTVLIGEHQAVYTTGRRFQAENSLDKMVHPKAGSPPENLLVPVPDVPIIAVERGGDITYHGPGQLMIYPIIKLSPVQRDLRGYLRALEQLVIDRLHAIGIQGIQIAGQSGLWVENSPDQSVKKIASVGVAIKQWVTYHGIALNVCPDMSAFLTIKPCGYPGAVMTSVEQVQRVMGNSTPISTNTMKRLFTEPVTHKTALMF
jgi:lipoyl(octanoyl) transferase